MGQLVYEEVAGPLAGLNALQRRGSRQVMPFLVNLYIPCNVDPLHHKLKVMQGLLYLIMLL